MTREIALRGGEVALVDDDDYENLAAFEWSLHTNGYAQRRSGSKRFYMHAVIAGAYSDHKNGNKLDNRRENLRPATKSQNAANSKLRKDNRSGYRGVRLHKASGLWMARVTQGGKEIASYHRSPIDAARARDVVANRLFGDFARLNFPEEK